MGNIKVISKANEKDFIKIRDLYWKVIDAMEGTPYDIWWRKGVHPSEAMIMNATARGELYILKEEDEVLGAFILNHEQNAGYKDVKWSSGALASKALALHLLCTAPERRGQGLGKTLLAGAFEIGKKEGMAALRLDVLINDLPAHALYEAMGFTLQGKKILTYPEGGAAEFYLYEKIL